ncbi:ATP-binding protein [Virgibacillus salinus]|uniref:histidine kinase n=1 Tax=Virgibacillus salinus TaxID=553311 RepID=A0A1H1C1W4_9BACI|nr:ATP-binding protein [Virgibacillus salinus]SDQ58227.1 two-component system, sporulation sensor kinase A [Virgibacillus salinus]
MENKDSNQQVENNKNKQNPTTTPDPQGFFNNIAALPPSILEWIDKNTNGFIAIWDKNGRIIYISKSVEQLLGYKVTDLLGTQWYEKVSNEDVTYIKNHFDTNQDSSQLFNIMIQNIYGKNIWTENLVSQIKDSNDNIYYAAAVKDITDKKEAEEMMIRSEKMSVAGQLAAGIAHEVRNPLTSLKGFLQLLQAGVNRKEEYYKIMIDEIEKMETITSELLFISKPLTDNKQIEKVQEMVVDVITLLRPQAKLKNIDILFEQTGSQTVYCDRSQIKQVLINIVKNAIEAMEEPGNIQLNVLTSEDSILLDVIDGGPGIPEEIIHKLKEPFFTTKQSGTGLGLMITTQILERHDGKLEILQNENKGSTFRIILPKQIEAK